MPAWGALILYKKDDIVSARIVGVFVEEAVAIRAVFNSFVELQLIEETFILFDACIDSRTLIQYYGDAPRLRQVLNNALHHTHTQLTYSVIPVSIQ